MLAMGIRQTKKTKEDGIFRQEMTSLREDFFNKNFCCIFFFQQIKHSLLYLCENCVTEASNRSPVSKDLSPLSGPKSLSSSSRAAW